MEENVRCVNREIRAPRSETTLLVAAGAADRLVLFELQRTTAENTTAVEPVPLAQQKKARKSASQKPGGEEPQTSLAEPVPAMIIPPQSNTERKGGQLEETTFNTDGDGEWKYKFCRSCGHAISPEQRQRTLDGYKTYCEVCGIPLHFPDDE